MRYKKPSITVDGLIVKGNDVLLVKRKNEPFRGRWALPGGFVNYGETVEDAVRREVKEETGLDSEIVELLGVYSDPSRDPRGHTISVVFILKPVGDNLRGGDDADEACYFSFNSLPELAFDHNKIILDYMRRKEHDMSKM